MYTLRSVARRASALGAVVALLGATVIPTAAVFADALNPLTERSLMLSSSSPGYTDTDGSGNSASAPNAIGENYAPAGSGPNGKQTGETFSFKVSSDSTSRPIKAFTLQYCTTAAGLCQAPGDNQGDQRNTDRETNATAHPLGRSDLDTVGSWTNGTGAGQFEVFINGTAADTGNWTMAAINAEDNAHSGALTGKKNLIRLTNSGGITPTTLDQIRIVFRASSSNYITNPGSGSFFVKINTYDSATVGDLIPATPADSNTHIIDGGVTVANVMTDSIHITTKVLETMSFSVGTRNRDTVNVVAEEGAGAVHGTCDPIQSPNNNRLNLGNPDAEYSLETGKAWDVNSYWRLSSNSSGGATVYYSGNTLANTVGDEIAPIGASKAVSTPGTEQFGLGFVNAGSDTFDSAFNTLVTNQPTRYHTPSAAPFTTLSTDTPSSPVQTASDEYNEATGTLDNGSGGPGSAKFAFQKSSLTTPVAIAQQNTDVISCATAKMRYVANIGADTPAGVYTTKINYLAAPQY